MQRMLLLFGLVAIFSNSSTRRLVTAAAEAVGCLQVGLLLARGL
jgi:hypothetical protein